MGFDRKRLGFTLMCSIKQPKPPKVIERDPIKEAADAANVSQGKANAMLAKKRKKLRSNSMYTGAGISGGGSSAGYASAYASAVPAQTLGGG